MKFSRVVSNSDHNMPAEVKSSVSACSSTDKKPVHISLSDEASDEKLNGDPKDDDDKVASTSEHDGNSSDMEEIDCLSDSPELFHEPGSSAEMEVSASCIEVPLEGGGVSDSRDTVNDESKDDGGNGSTRFDVGDLVWARTQTEVWWPAVVYDPSSSATKAPKAVKRGSVFLKYFGSGCYVWCGESDLKPFLEHFDRMSSQSYSRSFSGAIEKALSVIGQAITAKMTCPCFSKEEGGEEEKPSLDRGEDACEISKLGVAYSPPRFEPGLFVSRIRDMARSGRSNGKLDLTVVKNHLSAFYRSVGHCQLPLHLIKSSADPQDEAKNSASPRKRKKSKCYPFVNAKRKPVKDIEAIGKKASIEVNEHIEEACSSKWLAELRLAARDHSRNSDSLTGFSLGFRKFAFASSAGIACDEQRRTAQVSNRETPLDLPISLSSSTGKMNYPLMVAASQMKVPMALYPSIVAPKVKKKKKKKKRKRDEVESGGVVPDLNGDAFPENKPETPPPPCAGSIVLVFASNDTLPPRDTLITTFSRFGLLRESEIEAVDESTVRIPYERITEARFAFQSLEKSRPFGEALASFRLSVSTPPPVMRRRSYDSKNREPPIAPELMKRNVEAMKSTLEKAGASLSVEMRTKLEKEINLFLDKLSSMH
ncbi:hypothetical protein M569_04853 [Genlisea aurea]|uniref:PWWP domain-containing protein n=1 Tax=Genlisea aurea TaxID=192259 RepID=S8EBL5_9LAMI|nr:hypothetical protein M569_04853 [Genlisea aurea]